MMSKSRIEEMSQEPVPLAQREVINVPRNARIKSSTGIYHIMLRGINQQNIFEDEEDKIKFVDTLAGFIEKSNYIIYGYCLMDNHVHLVLKESDDSIAQIIKRISSSYVYWYNKKYKRCGHLFQERFKSEVVETDEYLLTVLRYIHRNPVMAGMVNTAEEYLWSSYQEILRNQGIVASNSILDLISLDRKKALEEFRLYTCETDITKCMDIDEKTLMPDNEIINYLRENGINCISMFQRLDKAEQTKLLKEIKSFKGSTNRQISRITGIPRSRIDRIE